MILQEVVLIGSDASCTIEIGSSFSDAYTYWFQSGAAGIQGKQVFSKENKLLVHTGVYMLHRMEEENESFNYWKF